MIRQEVIQEKTALTGHDSLLPFGGNKSVGNLRHEKIGRKQLVKPALRIGPELQRLG